MRAIGSGAGPLKPEVQKYLMAVMGCTFHDAYGLHESSGAVLFSTIPDKHLG